MTTSPKDTPKGEKNSKLSACGMTAEQRAEWISEHFLDQDSTQEQFKNFVLDQIVAAEDAARAEEFARGALDQQVRCKDHTKKAYAMGFAEAVEKVAAIAESYLMIGATMMNPQFEQIAKNTAEQIRALRPLGSGELK